MNVGLRDASFTDAIQQTRIPHYVLYPTGATARAETFGPYALDVAIDAPVSGDDRPLVVVSHGNSGSPWVFRGLAKHLARAGFVVSLVEHIGNSRSDNSLEGTLANLKNRPRQVHLAIDAVFEDEIVGAHVSRTAIGVIGMSVGGYTALAVAGGSPTAFHTETPDGQPCLIDVTHDDRIKALVLLAPAAVWYRDEGSLAKVKVPILMFTGEKDLVTSSFHSECIRNRVADPSAIDHRIVPNAGHFAFMSPFPPAMSRSDFPPAQDPEGFDRAAFQPVLYAAIESFLRAHAT
jgi:predicted dienelactone hydrolase